MIKWSRFVAMAVINLACLPAFPGQTAESALTVPPPLQIAIDYSYMRANAGPGQCGCFSMQGGAGEFAFQAWKNFSVVADLTGELTASSPILASRWRSFL